MYLYMAGSLHVDERLRSRYALPTTWLVAITIVSYYMISLMNICSHERSMLKHDNNNARYKSIEQCVDMYHTSHCVRTKLIYEFRCVKSMS